MFEISRGGPESVINRHNWAFYILYVFQPQYSQIDVTSQIGLQKVDRFASIL